MSDRSNGTLSQDERIVCYFSDSDDGTYHSDDKDSDSSADEQRYSDSDSDDTNTTDGGSLGTTEDFSYDSYGSDFFDIQPDYYDYYPTGYSNYAVGGYNLPTGLYPSHQGYQYLSAGPGHASQNQFYPYNQR